MSVTLADQLTALAESLDFDLSEVEGMVETVYPSYDPDTEKDVTYEAWERAIASHKRRTAFLRQLADNLPDIILSPRIK